MLTASDLNAEFNNLLNNARDLVSPLTGVLDMNGFELIMDADADSSLTADTNNRLDVRLGGVDLFVFDGTTASCVNGLTFTAVITGSGPTIAATGSDTNVAVTLKGKGTGAVILGQATSTDVRLAADQPIADSSGNEFLKFTKTATAVNEFTIVNAATGTPPRLQATGETNVSLQLEPKGSGTILLTDGTDITKKISLVLSGITTANTRNVTFPDRALTLRDAAVSATKQSASGVAVDFTGVPTWATKIIVQFVAISTNGTSNIIVQLGDSGGPETNGYSSVVTRGATYTASTAGLIVTQGTGATNVYHGQVVLCLADPALFTWTASANLADSATPEVNMSAGSKSTSAALDRVRITMVNGTDTFDAGIFNILYE